MARSQVLVSLAVLGLLIASASAVNTVTYNNISTSLQCTPTLFYDNGNSILCSPQSDYFISINISANTVGQPVYVCDTQTTPYIDPNGNFWCLSPGTALPNGTYLYNFYSFSPVSGQYTPSPQQYPATYTKFKQNYLLMAVENATVNASSITAMMFNTEDQGTPFCSFSVSGYTSVQDFTTYQTQVFVLALMANGSYDVLSVDCSSSPGNVTTNFYQPPAENSLYPSHGCIDIFSSFGVPFLLIFDPNFATPVSLSTIGTQTNVTNLPSRSVKKVIPTGKNTFITYTTCSVTLYSFNTTSNVGSSQSFNFGCWYFKVQYIESSGLLYIDDGINYFFLNTTSFQLYNIYSFNPTVPLADGSTVYFDHNGYFVQNGTTGNIDFTSVGLPFSNALLYVNPPYTNYYILGSRASSQDVLITIDVIASTITEANLTQAASKALDQTIYAIGDLSNPANLTIAASAAGKSGTVALLCNQSITYLDNPKGSFVYINQDNCTMTLVDQATALFKYNESVYAALNNSQIQLVDVNSHSSLQSVETNLNSSVILNCNWGAFDASPTPGATVVVNGFFASCSDVNNTNYLISEFGNSTALPGTDQGFIEIFYNTTNSSFQYCVPSAQYPEVSNCQLSYVTSWGSNVVPVPPSSGGSGAAWIIVILILLAVGGGAYYWFYYRKRQGGKSEPDHYQPFARGGNTSIEHNNE